MVVVVVGSVVVVVVVGSVVVVVVGSVVVVVGSVVVVVLGFVVVVVVLGFVVGSAGFVGTIIVARTDVGLCRWNFLEIKIPSILTAFIEIPCPGLRYFLTCLFPV